MRWWISARERSLKKDPDEIARLASVSTFSLYKIPG